MLHCWRWMNGERGGPSCFLPMLGGGCSAASQSTERVSKAVPPSADRGARRVHSPVGGGELVVDARDHVVELLQAMSELWKGQPRLIQCQTQDGFDGPEAARHV